MKDTIFYVGGSKGGVGKSIVALTLVQFLIDRYGDAKTKGARNICVNRKNIRF